MWEALWRVHNGSARTPIVGESEMDMNRHGPRPHGHRPRLWDWLRIGGGVIGSPRRSVDRELQEDWPTEY